MTYNPTGTLKAVLKSLEAIRDRLQTKRFSVENRLEDEYDKKKPDEKYIEYLKTSTYALHDIQIKVSHAVEETKEWISEMKVR